MILVVGEEPHPNRPNVARFCRYEGETVRTREQTGLVDEESVLASFVTTATPPAHSATSCPGRCAESFRFQVGHMDTWTHGHTRACVTRGDTLALTPRCTCAPRRPSPTREEGRARGVRPDTRPRSQPRTLTRAERSPTEPERRLRARARAWREAPGKRLPARPGKRLGGRRSGHAARGGCARGLASPR